MRTLCALAFFVALPAVAEEHEFHCDGTDPFFFAEMADAGTLGYGETWDEHVCDEGADTFAPGADSRWKKMRTPRVFRVSPEDQMLALVMPMAAVGGLGAIFLAAGAIAAVGRMKKRVVLEVACPSCDAPLPVPVDDAKAGDSGRELGMFCPMCGTACRVAVEGKGADVAARVIH
jgi:hypothetical protein